MLKMAEEQSVESLMKKLAEVNKRTNFQAKKVEVDKDGSIILDANNYADREWWRNDEGYNVIKE